MDDDKIHAMQLGLLSTEFFREFHILLSQLELPGVFHSPRLGKCFDRPMYELIDKKHSLFQHPARDAHFVFGQELPSFLAPLQCLLELAALIQCMSLSNEPPLHPMFLLVLVVDDQFPFSL